MGFKLTILGAAGLRTPLILQAILLRQAKLDLSELVLMDIDSERLELIAALTAPLEAANRPYFHIRRTTDLDTALQSADYVITTFRVGGMTARAIDERVPLNHGVLGQETTGPGGFAMGMRTIPILLSVAEKMKVLCPQAWLINFANPAGMLAEALIRVSGWQRSVGICDAPHTMRRALAALLNAPAEQVYLDYFGLNHLGWIRRVIYRGEDHLPRFLELIRQLDSVPGLPFSPTLITALRMIPNEYLYYYYHSRQAVENIQKSGLSRGEQLAAWNEKLFAELTALRASEDYEGMQSAYQAYLKQRGQTYMVNESGKAHNLDQLDATLAESLSSEGYAGVALDLIESLNGGIARQMILNLPNRGAIQGLESEEVVEIAALVSQGIIQPLSVGEIPKHCLGLMQQVKAYERLTIEAAVEGSYAKALTALTLHPLVPGFDVAKMILDEYIDRHGDLFPSLQ
ncbi:MAG: glycosyl hydrolase [Anaerolineales bacterium]